MAFLGHPSTVSFSIDMWSLVQVVKGIEETSMNESCIYTLHAPKFKMHEVLIG